VMWGRGSAPPVRIEDPPAHKLRIAVPRKFFCEELDPQVASAFEQALSVLSTMSDISEINLEVPTDRTLQKVESYAYHAKFVRQSPELYQPETLRRIRTGEDISPEDAARCKRDLQEARKQIASVFDSIDLLVTPTAPIPAPAIAELKANPDQLRPRELALLRNTRPMNVWGLRTSYRPADHRPPRGRVRSSAACARLRAGYSLAPRPAQLVASSGVLRRLPSSQFG